MKQDFFKQRWEKKNTFRAKSSNKGNLFSPYPDHFQVESTFFGQKRILEFKKDGFYWKLINGLGQFETYISNWTIENFNSCFNCREFNRKSIVIFKDTPEEIIPII